MGELITIKQQDGKAVVSEVADDKEARQPIGMTTTQIGESLGISAVQINKWLIAEGIVYKQGDTYLLHEPYKGQGYEMYKPYTIKRSSGETKTFDHLYWTEKGAEFIYEKLGY